MSRSAVLALAVALSGCVTTAGLVKPNQVSLPLLLGAAAGDLVVTGVIASQASDFTVGASIATALAVTAVDVGVGCLIGSCSALRL